MYVVARIKALQYVPPIESQMCDAAGWCDLWGTTSSSNNSTMATSYKLLAAINRLLSVGCWDNFLGYCVQHIWVAAYCGRLEVKVWKLYVQYRVTGDALGAGMIIPWWREMIYFLAFLPLLKTVAPYRSCITVSLGQLLHHVMTRTVFVRIV